jgi:glutamate synthase (NADPH/NADH) small chain
MKEEGITFICNTHIGIDISLEHIIEKNDAVLLCGGSTIPRDLDIPGRSSLGIYFAMDFLKQQNKKVAQKGISDDVINTINTKGKKVIIIGGGDTGSDCIGTSNRQKAKSITQLELLPIPPINRTESMPWPSFPMLLKNSSSHEEGAHRVWSVSTKEFIGDKDNKLVGLKICDLEWSIDGLGNKSYKEIANSERVIECDFVFLAMGFLSPDLEPFTKTLDIKKDARGNVAADEKSYKTNIDKVFAAGDMRRGQSLVVWAIREGREAARKVDEYLMGISKLPSCDSFT